MLLDVCFLFAEELSETDRNSVFTPSYYRKRKRNDSQTEQEATKACGLGARYDVIISEDKPDTRDISPLSVYIGAGFAVEIKEFRKNYYICFSKTVDGDIKNRMNLPLDQLKNIKKALEVTEKHVKRHQK